MPSLAAIEAPAAGAPTAQIAIATGFALLTTVALLWLVAGHRSGRSRALERAARASRRMFGLTSWAALPLAVAGAGLAAGGFGVFWDISLHIDEGRDAGPLANPSHYFILVCLYAIFAAGILAIVLHERTGRPAPRPVPLPGGMSAPVGGVLLVLCGAFSLSGFPLDDLWHRMFGQDVTLWGPTHLVMINGAIFAVPALIVLGLEAKRAAGHELTRPPASFGEHVMRLLLPGALLFAVAFWATEFDWGVPQYRQVWHPLLLAVAASTTLVAARLWTGRGGALLTVGIYLVERIVLTLLVGGLGQTMPALPLFLAEALCVELAARALAAERHPLRFGAVAGALCGSVGFAAEYAWTHVASPYPWSPALLAEGVPTAVLAGLAGGVLGALLGAALLGRLPAPPVRRATAVGAAVLLVVLGANALVVSDPSGLRADVALERAGDGTAFVVARVDGRDPRGAEWFTAMAWQGGGRVVAAMRPLGDGLWRSAEPVPVGGTWKTMLRLHDGRVMASIPLHLPRDTGIGTAGLTRPDRFAAAFVPDVDVMQTERRDYVPGWLWTPAALLMLAFCAVFVAAIAVGVARAVDEAPARTAPPSGRGTPAVLARSG